MSSPRRNQRPGLLARFGSCVLPGLVLVSAALALQPTHGPDRYWVEHWGPRQGFPEETIFSIAQTTDGYLWIATPAGLIRYDGRQFISYDRQRVPDLEARRLVCLLASRDGSLWLRNATGEVWRGNKGRFQRVEGTSARRLGAVTWFDEDSLGRIWIGAADGVHRWVNGRIEWDVIPLGVWRGRVRTFYLDRRSRLWLRVGKEGEPGRLIRMSPEGNSADLDFGPEQGLNSPVRSIAEDSQGRMWIATSDMLFRFEQNRLSPVREAAGGFSGELVKMLVDRHNALWISSKDGLGRLHEGRFVKLYTADALTRDAVQAIFMDRENNLWLGTRREGLYLLKDAKFSNATAADGLSSRHVDAVYRDRRGVVWAGTDQGVDRILPEGAIERLSVMHGLPAGGVKAIAEDGTGRLWLGGDSGLVMRVGETTFWPRSVGGRPPAVRALAASGGGGLWLAAQNSLVELTGEGEKAVALPSELNVAMTRCLLDSERYGLLVALFRGGLWSCRDGQCVRVPLTEPDQSSLTVYGLHEDDARDLWVISSSGLARVRRLNRSPGGAPELDIRWYDLAPYLDPDEQEFYQIAEDSHGRLWLPARRSIVRLDKVEPENLDASHVRQFDLRDGLHSSNFGVARQGYRSMGAGGVLWFPSMKGLAGVDPDAMNDNALPPPVHVETILVDGRNLEMTSGRAELPPGVERIEISFVGLSLVEPAKVRYRYQLEGFDAEWIEAGGVNHAVYTSLGTGSYRFRVQACNNDGLWNEQGATVDFEILPHFYERAWFLILGIAALAGAGRVMYRAHTRSLKEQNAKLERRVRERTAELERARTEAVEAARAKADFLATMSHEIRTPMNGVLGMVSLLDSMDLTDDQRACTEIISGSGQALLAILNDVLELSRIEAGKLDLAYSPVDLRRLCDDVAGLFRQTAETKGLKLRLQWSEGVPEWFTADGARLRQVLVNLVGNAVKFTDRGSIDVEVSGHPVSDEQQWALTIGVRDTGIGMGINQLRKLFQKFSQADSSASRKYGGTGLGLAISRRLAENMGGTIEVSSAPGRGSSFRLVITLAPALRPSESPKVTPAAGGEAASCCRILLAEDNAVNVKVATGMLARLGYAVKVAGNGLEALEAAERERFDIIFMDCQMPELDGFEATRLIRDRGKGSPAPVIVAMTANAMEGDRERCLSAGMDDYLAKPIVLQDLASMLDRWAKRPPAAG